MATAGVLGDRIVPSINAVATAVGRPDPRVVAGLPGCITTDPDGARQRAAEQFGIYGRGDRAAVAASTDQPDSGP